MENVTVVDGNALIVLILGGALVLWGVRKYVVHSLWLSESRETSARVISIEKVMRETESSMEEYDQPTFRYNTTGEVLIAQARQFFPKGTLKVGDPHTIRYNNRTPGRIHTDSADDLGLMAVLVLLFIGGILIFISYILFTG